MAAAEAEAAEAVAAAAEAEEAAEEAAEAAEAAEVEAAEEDPDAPLTFYKVRSAAAAEEEEGGGLAGARKRLGELENAAGVWREIAEHAARETVLPPEVAEDAGWRQLVAEVEEEAAAGGGGGGGDAAALAATGDNGSPSPVASGARRVVAVVAVSMRWEVGGDAHTCMGAHVPGRTHTPHTRARTRARAHTQTRTHTHAYLAGHDTRAARAPRHCAAPLCPVYPPGARQAPCATPDAAEPRGC